MTDETTVEEQLTLLPAERPIPIRQDLELAILPPHLDGVPDADLVRSVETFGVIEPVVATVKGGQWTVQAGRRRVGAARKVGLKSVPAMVYREDDWDPCVLTLIENMIRSANPIAQAKVVARYIRSGRSIEEVAKETHIPVTQLRALLPLTTLPDPFVEAVDGGKIAPGVAKQIAKLDKSQQDDLIGVLADKKEVTGKDVQKVREVTVEAATQSLMAGLDDVSEVVEAPWHIAVEELLRKALGLCASQEENHGVGYSIELTLQRIDTIKRALKVGEGVPF